MTFKFDGYKYHRFRGLLGGKLENGDILRNVEKNGKYHNSMLFDITDFS